MRSFWKAFVATHVVLTTISALQFALSMPAVGTPLDTRVLLVAYGTTFITTFLYAPVLWLVRRGWPAERVGWPLHAAAITASLAGFVALQTATALPLERIIEPNLVFRGSLVAKGLGQFVAIASTVAAATLVELNGALRARESHALQLQARLAEARLQALTLQLHPHFHFNTLTAISVLVHRDPAGADTMLTRLADLLRATLRRPALNEIPLRDEMALLGRYVDIMRVRFGGRLTIEERMPAELAGYLVPSFVLQPLVENALEHGIARRAGPGLVIVSAERSDGHLQLTVTDDGPGLPSVAPADGEGGGGAGIGLANTRLRLEQLYGAGRWLTLEPGPTGGMRATVRMPLRDGTLTPSVSEAWT
jgi:signal transduction histidine kinase